MQTSWEIIADAHLDTVRAQEQRILKLETLIETMKIDVSRYNRLRILGCSTNQPLYSVLRFQNLDNYCDNEIKNYPNRGEYKE